MDRIVEIAVILTDVQGRTQHEWSTRINPEVPMAATEIHGLTDADVANAPTFSVVTNHIVGLFRGRAIVAHNAGFDLGFLELLLAALEDGAITEQERADLSDAAAAFELEGSQVEASRLAVAQALADAAVDDGTISKHERTEIKQILVALGLPESRAAKLLSEAEVRRFVRLSEGLPPLPDGWDLGEPLRVGDNIAFTGCADSLREQWEREATAKGIYVGGVSKKTVFLESDGTMDGAKAKKAQDLGTRVVTPEEFSLLLRHLQPYGC